MDDDGKNKTDRNLIQSVNQLDAIFRWLFDDKNDLHNGVFQLLDIIDDPVISDLFDNYPKLLEKYKLKELLSGKIEIEYTDVVEVQRACLLATLQSLLLCVEQMYLSGKLKKPIEESDNIDLKMIRFIVESIPLPDLLTNLSQLIRFVVGVGYYKTFIEKLSDKDNAASSAVNSQKEYYQVMMWFGMVRLFLDGVGFWIGDERE